MTYQQKHDELLGLVIHKLETFQGEDNDIFVTNELGDIDLMPNYKMAYAEWQQALNDAHKFIASFKKSGKLADDQIL
jgi:hypothetical protein